MANLKSVKKIFNKMCPKIDTWKLLVDIFSYSGAVPTEITIISSSFAWTFSLNPHKILWGFGGFFHLYFLAPFSFRISVKVPWNISSGLTDLYLYDYFPYVPILLCSYIFQDPCKFSNILFFNILQLYHPVVMSSLV